MASAPRLGIPLLLSALPIVLAGCFLSFSPSGDDDDVAAEGPVVPSEPGGDRFPDVLEVRLEPAGDRMFDVRVTLSSPYDTPQRYADGWRVLGPDGTVLGSHTLLHDHANEQPFTRVQRGLVIPEGVVEVTVQGRDQANGFGGLTLTVSVPTAE